MADINRDGATGTTLAEYKERVEAAYLDIDAGWNIDPSTPDGLAIAIWAEMLANLDEEVINSYQSVDPDSAIGVQLNRIAAISGNVRKVATFSTARVTFTGVPLTVIPAGTLVRHRLTSTLWKTDADVVTNTDGLAMVGVTCMLTGEQNANAGTLTIIATPIGGITAVDNAAAASLGTDEESDDAFRVRRNESVALPGNNQRDNIYAALINVPGVKQVKIYENPDSVSDSNGILAHSMAIFIDGGEQLDIVAAMAANKNPGCGLNRYNTFIPNKISVDTTTPLTAQPFNATFFRPENVTVYVKVTIVSDTLSATDNARIKAAIINDSVYGFLETNGFAKTGFRIGEAIASGRLYTPVNKIVGNDDYVASILIGTRADDVTHSLLNLAFYQLGVFDVGNIEVTYAAP